MADERAQRSSSTVATPEPEVAPRLAAPGLAEGRENKDSRPAVRELSVKDVRELIAGAPPEPGDSLWLELQADPRKGVRSLLAALSRRREREAAIRRREQWMRRFEAELWEEGLDLVAGIDEAGRGPLAGPVVAAAVVLPREIPFSGIDDSKKLTHERREELHDLIRSHAVGVGVGSVSHDVIDEINILRATRRSMREALQDLAGVLGRPPDHVLVDGDDVPDMPVPQTGIHSGDQLSTAIAAASIIAKVTRDRILVEYETSYPGYGFAHHKGYGTPEHMAALTKLGPCEIHRRSFSPVTSTTGFSELYDRFRKMLLSAGAPEALEEAAREIAGASESLDPYELSRLRNLYKRSYARLRVGLTGRR